MLFFSPERRDLLQSTVPAEALPAKGQPDIHTLSVLKSDTHKETRTPSTRHSSSPNHPHIRVKRSGSLHEVFSTPLLTAPTRPHHNTPTQNFTLEVQRGHVLLLYGRDPVVDLTAPTRLILTSANVLTYRRGAVTSTAGIAEAGHFPGIRKLAIYDGSKLRIHERTSKGVLLAARKGVLFLSTDMAFCSFSEQFNLLLDEKLAQVFTNNDYRVEISVESQPLSGGGSVLVVNKTAIIALTGIESRSISNEQFMLYEDDTLVVQEGLEWNEVEVFPQVQQVYLLHGLAEGGPGGITRHCHNMAERIPGGGELYVHPLTRTAFYSRDTATNKKIAGVMDSSRLPPNKTVFSIRFQTSKDGRGLEAVVMGNGGDVLRLKPARVLTQSLAPQHYLVLRENTIHIVDEELETCIDVMGNVHQIWVYDNDTLTAHTGSSGQQFPGGGQVFLCKGTALYSVDTGLSDRIGAAILAVESHTPSALPSWSQGREEGGRREGEHSDKDQ